jgi:hypothetical protein
MAVPIMMISMISNIILKIAFFVIQTFSLEVKYTHYNKKARTSSVNCDKKK